MTFTLADLLIVAFLGALAFYWLSATRVRELAMAAAERSAKTADVQLLDQTVSLVRVSLSRDHAGRWRVWRQYRFEYSRDGFNREMGHIIMLGHRLEAVLVPESPTLH